MENFVNLKVATEYSKFGGICKVDDLIKKAKQYNMTALCKTDWGPTGFNGNIEFYNKCISNGIKPVIGIRSRVRFNGEKVFVTLYAKNINGYNNLHKIFDGKYGPSVEDVVENHDSLVCIVKECDNCTNIMNILKQTFNDDLYVGLMGSDDYYNDLKELAQANGLKTVILQTVCFVNKDDLDAYRAKKKKIDIENGLEPFPDEPYEEDLYFKSYDEMVHMYPNDIESILRTQEIADKCNLVFDVSK